MFLNFSFSPYQHTLPSVSTDVSWRCGAMEKQLKCWRINWDINVSLIPYRSTARYLARSSIQKDSRCHFLIPFALFWPAASELRMKKREWHTLTPMHLHTSSKTFPCGGVFLYSPLPAMNTTEKDYNPDENLRDWSLILLCFLGRIPHPHIQQKFSPFEAYMAELSSNQTNV